MSSLDEYSKAVRSVQNAKADKKEHPKGWEPGVVLNGGKSYVASGPCLLYTSPSPRDLSTSRMPSSA